MYQYIIAKYFKKQLKPYAKKFPGIFLDVIHELTYFNKARAIRLGGNLYKLRLSVTQLKKGKSKSFRLIIYLIENDSLIIPVTIFIKSEKGNMKTKEIKYHVDNLNNDLKNTDYFL